MTDSATSRPGEATEPPAAELAPGEPPPALEFELEDVPAGSIETAATIHLRGAGGKGIGPGDVVTVDPDDPYIAACLRARYLVPTGAELVTEPDAK